MELNELEVGDSGARAIGHPDPVAARARRICRVLPERGSTAGCKEHCARFDRAPIRDDANATSPGDPELERELVLADLDARFGQHRVAEDACDPFPGRGAVNAENARVRMAPLEPKLVVEAHAQLDEVGDPRGCLLTENLDCARPTEPAARPDRVLGMKLRAVARPGRRGHPALREVARRSANRAFGQDQNTAVGSGGERTEEAGDASSHYDQVKAISRVHPRSASSVW